MYWSIFIYIGDLVTSHYIIFWWHQHVELAFAVLAVEDHGLCSHVTFFLQYLCMYTYSRRALIIVYFVIYLPRVVICNHV